MLRKGLPPAKRQEGGKEEDVEQTRGPKSDFQRINVFLGPPGFSACEQILLLYLSIQS